MIIRVENLNKTFKVYERGGSFLDTTRSLFKRSYRNITAVGDISFDVQEGELLGFIGPNGAGKSTTLKMLTGILYPSSGNVDILGFTPWKQRKKYVRNIGAVFGQKSQLMWDIPPLDAFLLNKAVFDIKQAEFNETLHQMVELLDIGGIIKKPTRQLSLGERMKCEFVMAMLHRPKIVFLDEPTIGLDVVAKDRIREFITEMNQKGTTFILTTHDIGDIEKLARRVIIINHGKIVCNDSLDRLVNTQQKVINIITKRPIDTSKIEYIEAQMISPNEARLIIDITQNDIGSIISEINDRFSLSDLKIEELPVENVIKDIYRQ